MRNFTDQELEKLLVDLESDRVERKSTYNKALFDKICGVICAFANDLPNHNQPGVLFIGAEDNGEPSSLSITDELITQLGNITKDGYILPPPAITVRKHHLKGADMAVIVVMPSESPPVKYQGCTWIRRGSTQHWANAEEERLLNEKRLSKTAFFDISPIPTANISDLSKSIFENDYLPRAFAPDVLEANERTYEDRLASCKMISSVRHPIPTVLGLLAMGKNPQDFLPGAYIQFLRINGMETVDEIIDQEEINGTLVEILRRAEEKIKAHNTVAINITAGTTHTLYSPYPLVALQQILYNAVHHRLYEGTNTPIRFYWFNDRIEISSPGGPFGRVTCANFGQPGVSDYRNPNIGEFLKNAGFIQKFGMGISLARSTLLKNGNPPLEFKVDSQFISCIIRAKS